MRFWGVGKTLLIIIVGAFIIYIYIKYIERKSVFFPTDVISATPELVGLPFEDVYLDTQDNVTLHGWFLPHDGARYTILFLHGNGGNVGHRLEKLLILHRLGVNVFIIDYRGFGRSKGSPTEGGVYLDAQAAYTYLLKNKGVKRERIILYGESKKYSKAAAVIEKNMALAKNPRRRYFKLLNG